jgi:hypothetical protein
MQIDFHHTVTYVAARIAGFTDEDAGIIAYSAQYVDDATNSGSVVFANMALYTRISSAHKSVDLKNLDDVENHLVWIPFHFLPGNGGLPAGKSPSEKFIDKLVCWPDSPPAREMLETAFQQRENPNALHRLGITMHVYADTWAHQGFAGVLHEVNEADDAVETDGAGVFGDLGTFLFGVLDDAIPPLGHGRVNIFPDMPFLSWEYKNGRDETIARNNTDIFCEAADALCRAMQEFRRLRDVNVQVTGIGASDLGVMRRLFSTLTMKESEQRHRAWLQAISVGEFSFGSATVSYDAEGRNSWKAHALGTSLDLPVHSYNDDFLTCNWRLFHNALQQHRISILHDILPKYGICAG